MHAAPLRTAGWVEFLAWLVCRRRRFRVSGESMAPLLQDADEVLVDPRAEVRVGDVVVTRHPFRRDLHLVKRLVAFDDAGRARLEGDNPAQSTDSRTLGAVPRELIVGRVSSRLP